MLQINKLIINIFIWTVFFIVPMVYCNGQIITGDTDAQIFDQTEAFMNTSGFEHVDQEGGVAIIISMVIRGFLSVLGIIFVVLMVLAGYNWMTAGGNEEKVEKAKDTIRRAIIGLIITASAYAITIFVFSNL